MDRYRGELSDRCPLALDMDEDTDVEADAPGCHVEVLIEDDDYSTFARTYLMRPLTDLSAPSGSVASTGPSRLSLIFRRRSDGTSSSAPSPVLPPIVLHYDTVDEHYRHHRVPILDDLPPGFQPLPTDVTEVPAAEASRLWSGKGVFSSSSHSNSGSDFLPE
ncbi:hypothetical protein Tsubulata_043301 [Turnera subulata]|uniref:Uncharacterized protein n=1 Tax=Turnera subulata TaxID=218843 RepID=A0A9Q0J430_9ROSI|nr:hypothetical protein Tsubulata_043301 [Turnera subulata]